MNILNIAGMMILFFVFIFIPVAIERCVMPNLQRKRRVEMIKRQQQIQCAFDHAMALVGGASPLNGRPVTMDDACLAVKMNEVACGPTARCAEAQLKEIGVTDVAFHHLGGHYVLRDELTGLLYDIECASGAFQKEALPLYEREQLLAGANGSDEKIAAIRDAYARHWLSQRAAPMQVRLMDERLGRYDERHVMHCDEYRLRVQDYMAVIPRFTYTATSGPGQCLLKICIRCGVPVILCVQLNNHAGLGITCHAEEIASKALDLLVARGVIASTRTMSLVDRFFPEVFARKKQEDLLQFFTEQAVWIEHFPVSPRAPGGSAALLEFDEKLRPAWNYMPLDAAIRASGLDAEFFDIKADLLDVDAHVAVC